jgi:hypothetical protein
MGSCRDYLAKTDWGRRQLPGGLRRSARQRRPHFILVRQLLPLPNCQRTNPHQGCGKEHCRTLAKSGNTGKKIFRRRTTIYPVWGGTRLADFGETIYYSPMTASLPPILDRIDADGFAVLSGVFSRCRAADILHHLQAALGSDQAGAALRAQGGTVYAARNVLDLWPPVRSVWKQPPLPELLAAILGHAAGLVRVLYFDKPPGQSWALPWHKDVAIAVRANRLPSTVFGTPTTKAGVPHVEAPQEILENMLTLRIHLDDITEENGPLKVIPGSHRGVETQDPHTIFSQAGDVLLMRPLVSHCSIRSHADTSRHRRILHLEFAGTPLLADGYEWHDFWR